jgi:hypothetical protein
VLHFQAPEGHQYRRENLSFFQQHLEPHKGIDLEPEHLPFLWGYFTHLVTDNLWDQRIGLPPQ